MKKIKLQIEKGEFKRLNYSLQNCNYETFSDLLYHISSYEHRHDNSNCK